MLFSMSDGVYIEDIIKSEIAINRPDRSFRGVRRKYMLQSILIGLNGLQFNHPDNNSGSIRGAGKLYADNPYHQKLFSEIIEKEINFKNESLQYAINGKREDIITELNIDIEILSEYWPATVEKTDIIKKQENNEGESVSGTAFIINDKGHLITNAHVVNNNTDMIVTLRGENYEAKVVATDNVNDLALLKSDLKDMKHFKFSNHDAHRLEDITALGFGFGKSFSSDVKATKGIVSSLSGIGNNYSQLQIDASIQSGNSGGPIINKASCVIGIAVAKLDTEVAYRELGAIPENINFGVKVSTIKQFLDSNDINYIIKEDEEENITSIEINKIIDESVLYIFNK